MCRSIKVLRHPDGPPTESEVREAALQFVRKISGYRTRRGPTLRRSSGRSTVSSPRLRNSWRPWPVTLPSASEAIS